METEKSRPWGWLLTVTAMGGLLCWQGFKIHQLEAALANGSTPAVKAVATTKATTTTAKNGGGKSGSGTTGAQVTATTASGRTVAPPDTAKTPAYTPPPIPLSPPIDTAAANRAEVAQLLNSAREAFNKSDYDSAINQLNQLLQKDPGNDQALQLMGNLCRNLGLRDEERSCYEAWSKAHPEASMPHYQLARLFSEQGMKAEALAAANKYAEMNQGGNASAASLYRQLGLAAEEQASLQAWVAREPQSIDAHRWLGDYNSRTNNTKGALEEYQKILDVQPSDVDAYLGIANLYNNQQQPAKALEPLTKAVTLRPGDMNLRLRLASAYSSTNNRDLAIATYKDIVQFAPESAAGRNAAQILQSMQPSK